LIGLPRAMMLVRPNTKGEAGVFAGSADGGGIGWEAELGRGKAAVCGQTSRPGNSCGWTMRTRPWPEGLPAQAFAEAEASAKGG
jgi:hypothetical protein